MSSKRGRSHSPAELKDDHTKGSGSYGRKDNLGGLENDSSHARSGRGHGSTRHSDKYSYGGSGEFKRHDDHRNYHDKRADDNDRSHSRTSRTDRESRADTCYDPSRRDRSHGDMRNVDSRYEGKSAKREQRAKNQEKQVSPRDDSGKYEKYVDLRKETHSTRRYPEDKESKRKEKFMQDEPTKKRNGKEIVNISHVSEPEVEPKEKRRSLFSSAGLDIANAQQLENDTTKQPSLDSGGIKDGSINEVNAAKAAAMKAAELVNKNIVGFGVGAGRLSTDQKKKLLWGNKKSNPPETSTHWDSNLFSDRERQEKFNKLMGVKSSASASVQGDNKEEGPVEVKKQEELDTDLEKLYVAGLRRRDGRTVGLGL